MGRVVLGGIVAALVVNAGELLLGLLLKREYEVAMRMLGVRVTSRAALYLPIAWSLVVGILSIWLYAAIRPRYGPGAPTAVRAALAVWALTTLTFAIVMASLGLFPPRLMAFSTAWSLVETTVAVLAGAALYREG